MICIWIGCEEILTLGKDGWKPADHAEEAHAEAEWQQIKAAAIAAEGHQPRSID